MTNRFFIDIETVPKNLSEDEKKDLLAKPRKWIGHLRREQTDQEVIDSLSLHACKFQVVAVAAVATQDNIRVGNFVEAGLIERDLLCYLFDFFETIMAKYRGEWHFGGHNIKEFDLPRLALAGARHGLRALSNEFLKAIRDEKTIDTCAFPGWRPSLKDLELELLQTKQKTDDGKNMQQLVANGEWDRIREYCHTDARLSFCVAEALGLMGERE